MFSYILLFFEIISILFKKTKNLKISKNMSEQCIRK